jgi:hypothetical protein
MQPRIAFRLVHGPAFSSRHPKRPDPRRSRKRHFDAFQRFSVFVKTRGGKQSLFSDGRGAIPIGSRVTSRV